MIKEFILTNNSSFIKQLRQSIKIVEIEERMDLLIHRPIGLVMSWGAIKLGMTPLQISLLSMFTGIVAGVLYFWHFNFWMAALAGFFLVLSGILDTVDGQVARLTGQSSQFGMVIDGTIDNVVFVAAYTGAALPYWSEYQWYGVGVVIVSGFLHSLQSLVFDYYKNEFSFLYAEQKHYRNPETEETKVQLQNAKGFLEKLLRAFYLDYVRKQNWLTTRKGTIKQRFETLATNPETKDQFKQEYKKTFSPYMTFWALFGGSNTHRTLIIIACLFAAFDMYLYINIALTLPVILLTFLQARADRKFLSRFP